MLQADSRAKSAVTDSCDGRIRRLLRFVAFGEKEKDASVFKDYEYVY